MGVRIGFYMQKTLISLNNFYKKLPTSIIFHFIVVIYIIGSLFYLNSVYQNYFRLEKEELFNFAQTAELFLDPVDITNLDVMINDVNKPNYQFLKSNLIKLKESKNNITFAYLMSMIDHKIYFLVDSEDPTSEDYSYPGQYYYEATENDFSAFYLNQTILTDETTDRWGTWISILVPINYNNEVIAVLGLDFDAAIFRQKIMVQTLNHLFIVFSIVYLIMVFNLYLKKNH